MFWPGRARPTMQNGGVRSEPGVFLIFPDSLRQCLAYCDCGPIFLSCFDTNPPTPCRCGRFYYIGHVHCVRGGISTFRVLLGGRGAGFYVWVCMRQGVK